MLPGTRASHLQPQFPHSLSEKVPPEAPVNFGVLEERWLPPEHRASLGGWDAGWDAPSQPGVLPSKPLLLVAT